MNLTALQNSAFLKSLGWAIANSLWQAAVLFTAYHIIIIFYKNASAKFKNNTSTTFLFLTFTWFILTFLTRFIQLKNEVIKIEEVNISSIKEYISLPDQSVALRFMDSMLTGLPYLSMAYLILLLLFSFRLINSYRNTSFIKNNGLEKPDVEWRLFTEKVSNHISIKKKVSIWLSQYVDVPATIGFFKPVILIPVASVNQLSVDQLEAIILHELSHIKRNDYLINLLISIFETILFFNPFVTLLSKIIKRERENCCDDFVLQYQYDRHSYASALLSLEQYRNQNLKLALTATSGKKQLLIRIKRIMEVKNRNNSFNYGQKLLALLFVTCIIGSIAWLSPDKRLNQDSSLIFKNTQLSPPKTITKSNALKNFDNNLNNQNGQTKNFLQDNSFKNENRLKLNQYIDNYASSDELIAAETEVENNKKVLAEDLQITNLDKVLIPSAPQGYLADTKILNNLPAIVNIDQLKLDLAKANASIASLDWNKINDDINVNLKEIKWPKEIKDIMQNIQFDKIITGIELGKKEVKEKKIQLEKNLEALSQLHKEQDDKIINKLKDKLTHVRDSAFVNGSERFQFDQKFLNSNVAPNFDLKEMHIQKVRVEKNNAEQSYNFSFSNSDDDHSKKTLTLSHGNKKATSDKLSIEFKDGMVYLNGEKINSINKEKVETYLKSKKLVIAFDDDNKEAETEADNN